MKESAQKIVRRTRGRGIGAAQFNYSIKAVTGQSAAATVDLNIQNVNDAPVAMGRFGVAMNDAVFAVRRFG